MNKRLKTARTMLLVVGFLQFAIDMVMVHAVYGDRLTGSYKSKLTIISALILSGFVGLWVLSKRKPTLALGLGLALFWGLHLYLATLNPASLTQGIILKVGFTVALIQGLKAATDAEKIRQDLGTVFE